METKKTLRSAAIVLLLLASTFQITHAQVDRIRQKSQENTEQRNNNNPAPRQENNNNNQGGSYDNTPSYTPNNYSSDSYESNESSSSSDNYYSGEGCAAGCLGIEQMFSGIYDAHHNSLKTEKKGGFNTSVELYPQLAYGNTGMLTLLPRLRLSRGLFSTDVRYCTLSEVLKESGATYSTWDWQIMQINLSPNSAVNVRLGTGFMKEEYSQLFFHEHSFGLDFRISPRIFGAAEARVSHDYQTNVYPRQEVGLRLHYSFIDVAPFHIYLTAGGMLQTYYSEVNIWSAQSGFALVLR